MVTMNPKIKFPLRIDHTFQQHTSKSQDLKPSPARHRPSSSQAIYTFSSSLTKSPYLKNASKQPHMLQNASSSEWYERRKQIKPFANSTVSSTVSVLSPSSSARNGFSSNPCYVKKITANHLQQKFVNTKILEKSEAESMQANGPILNSSIQTKSSLNSSFASPFLDASNSLLTEPSFNVVPSYDAREDEGGETETVLTMTAANAETDRISGEDHNIAKIIDTEETTLSFVRLKNNRDENSFAKISVEQASGLGGEENFPLSPFSQLIHKREVNSTGTSNMTKKERRVRFSGTVTTNQITVEPSYVSTLNLSLSAQPKQNGNLYTVHHASATNGVTGNFREFKLNKTTINKLVDTSQNQVRENDYSTFVTPVMKVVVTKRGTPLGEWNEKSNRSSAVRLPDFETPRQKLTTTSLLNKTKLRAGIKLKERPSTALTTHRNSQDDNRADTVRVFKLAPRKPTVVTPNFFTQPTPSNRTYPQRTQSAKFINVSSNHATLSSSVSESNRYTKESIAKKTTSSRKQNLRSRLSNAKRNSSTSPSATRPTHRQSTKDNTVNEQQTGDAVQPETPSIAIPTAENLSDARNATASPHVSHIDIQPIYSMPDYKNFCDPWKTELILNWLKDVNKKRNIEARIRRAASLKTRASVA